MKGTIIEELVPRLDEPRLHCEDPLWDPEVPRRPLILFPEDGDALPAEREGRLVRLTWAPSALAAGCRYEVEIADDREFERVILSLFTADGGQVPVWVPVRKTSYHWRLRAIDGCGQVGAWSAPAEFQVEAEEIPEPATDVPENVGSLLSVLKLFRRVPGCSSDPE